MKSVKHQIVLLLFLILLLPSCGIRRVATLPQFSDNPLVRTFDPLNAAQKDSLLSLYGNNKAFVEEYLNATLIALSYFPELRNTRIEFRYSNERTTMAARPKTLSVFGRKRYLILINNRADFEGILLNTVPFNAQVGIIAHELEHIADYETRNLIGIVGIGLRYLDPVRRVLFEREIDRATIQRGLGWQLYDWAMYSMFESENATEKYQIFKRENYKNPEEIEHLIRFLSGYFNTLD
jgi:hypothetical protein